MARDPDDPFVFLEIGDEGHGCGVLGSQILVKVSNDMINGVCYI